MRLVRFRWLTVVLSGFLFAAALLSWGCSGGGVSPTAGGADMAALPASTPDGGPPAPPNLKDWEGRLPAQAQRLNAPVPEVTPEASPIPSPPPPPRPPGTVEIEMASGWNMVSFPVADVTFLELGPGVEPFAFWWNAGLRTYEVIDPSDLSAVNAAAAQGSARGFWFFTTQPSTLAYAGTGQVQGVALRSGWNLIGIPSARLGDLMMSAGGGTAKPLAGSVCLPMPPTAGCLAYQNAFSYVAAQGSYGVVDCGQAEAQVEAGTAVWLYAHADAQLGFAGASGSRLFVPNVSAIPGGLAEVRILATSVDPVAGFDLTLTLDPKVATFAGGIPSDQGGFHIRSTTTATTTRIVMVSPTAESFQGTEVIRVPIRVASGATVGTSPLSVSGQFWSQAAAKMADPAPGSGSLMVQAGGAPILGKSVLSASSTDVRLQIPALNQNDSSIYESASLYSSIHSIACKVTDYLMVRRVFDGNAKIRDGEDWIDGTGAAPPPWPRPDLGLLRDNREVVKNWIRSGKPVVAGANSPSSINHWVLIIGFEGDQFYVNDPWGGRAWVPIQDATRYSESWVAQGLDVVVPFESTQPPVCASEIGCNSSRKANFQACYVRNGGMAQVGCPIDAGGTVCAHWWGNSTKSVIQDFDGGSGSRGAIIDNEGADGGTYWVHGAIWEKYLAAGAIDGPLGRPLSDEQDATRSPQGTTGRYSSFEGGAIHSSHRGAYATFGEIFRLYDARSGSGGSLGFPVSDIYTYNGAKQQEFEGGILREGAAFPIDPKVGCNASEPHKQHYIDAWIRHGGAAVVGTPINGLCTRWWGTNLRVVIQDFDGGSAGRGAILDDVDGQPNHTKAWWLRGPIWQKYADWGGPDSALGRPAGDQLSGGRSPQGTLGNVQRFEKGSIYYSSPYGAVPVYGSISVQYEAQGGATGPLGYPKGDRYKVDNVSVQDFQGGRLDINVAPNPPILTAPASWSVGNSRNITFKWSDGGDPDNGPRPYRTFRVEVSTTENTSVAVWEGEGTSWTWQAPSDGTWTWKVFAGDGFERSAPSQVWYVKVDATPPSVPGYFDARGYDSTRVNLSWNESTDNYSGIKEYVVRRDGAVVGRTNELVFTDTGLSPDTSYSYTVAAADYAGNEAMTASRTTRTLAANQPPGTPMPQSPADGSWSKSRSVSLSWSDGGDPDGAPQPTRTFNVEILQPNGGIQESSGWVASLLWTWMAPADGTWSWTVRAFDGVAESPRSSARMLKVDTAPPSRPTNVHVVSKTAREVVLAWTASTDAFAGVEKYSIKKDGALLGNSSQTGYTASGLTPASTLTFLVSALDWAGNESPESVPLVVQLPGETRAPGDVDGDGQFTTADLDLVMDGILGVVTLTTAEKAAADLDGSGALDVGDAIRWLQDVALPRQGPHLVIPQG